MKPHLILLGAVIALSASVHAYAGLLSKDELKRENARINVTYLSEKQACDGRSGNAKDVCLAEAKGNQSVAQTELASRNLGTTKARQEFLVAKAQANYDVAKARCDDFAGNAKSVCQKDAEAALTKFKADAKLERKVTDANMAAAETIINAQEQTLNAKREADFKAARVRCDSLAGIAKDGCVTDAKSLFGMR